MTRARPTTCLSIVMCLLVGAATATAQDAAQYFRQNCASCHTIGGGRLTGPDLAGVAGRRDRPWLTRYLIDPKAVIDSGDPYAKQLLDEAGGVVMPTPPGMSAALAESLLALIDAESALPRSQFAGRQVSDRPFGPADVAAGDALFTGRTRLAGGGPPCLSCHSVGGVGALGGGKLGPDLTLVYERLNGRKGLGAWLSAPATPTMQTVFRQTRLADADLEPLLAFFEDAARRRAEADAVTPLTFFLLGLGGAALGAVVMDLTWLHRLRSVRRRLVDAVTSRGTR